MRQFAVSNNVIVWTASQLNRAGAEKKIAGATDIAEGWGKVWIADNVLIIQPQSEEDGDHLMRLTGDKVRNGARGWTIHLRYDFSRMLIREASKEDIDAAAKSAKANKPAQKERQISEQEKRKRLDELRERSRQDTEK
jgi:hypothetical protein